jgi:hypothetical protein
MKDTTNLVLQVITRKQRTKPIGFAHKFAMPQEMAIKWVTRITSYINSIKDEMQRDMHPTHAEPEQPTKPTQE